MESVQFFHLCGWLLFTIPTRFETQPEKTEQNCDTKGPTR